MASLSPDLTPSPTTVVGDRILLDDSVSSSYNLSFSEKAVTTCESPSLLPCHRTASC